MSSTELDGFTIFFSSYYSQIRTNLPWMRKNLCSLRFGNNRMRCLSYSFDKSRYNPHKGSLSWLKLVSRPKCLWIDPPDNVLDYLGWLVLFLQIEKVVIQYCFVSSNIVVVFLSAFVKAFFFLTFFFYLIKSWASHSKFGSFYIPCSPTQSLKKLVNIIMKVWGFQKQKQSSETENLFWHGEHVNL